MFRGADAVWELLLVENGVLYESIFVVDVARDLQCFHIQMRSRRHIQGLRGIQHCLRLGTK